MIVREREGGGEMKPKTKDFLWPKYKEKAHGHEGDTRYRVQDQIYLAVMLVCTLHECWQILYNSAALNYTLRMKCFCFYS